MTQIVRIAARLADRAGRACAAILLALALAGCQSSAQLGDGLLPYSSVSASGGSAAYGTPGPAEIRGASALVMDYRSGRILHEESVDAIRYPASLTKMMTLYMLFEAIETGQVTPSTPLRVSERAASREPSKLGLKAGGSITVADAARALAVKSANDVATTIAENLAGSEEAFAVAMTGRARSLGMSRTVFVNASGLPDSRQVTTARDMATLGRSLLARFPTYAPLFAAQSFEYEGTTYRATNKLLGKVEGVDGLKTGYIRDSGFQLVATALRGGRRVIVVVMGGRTGRERDARVVQLIDEYLGPGAARLAAR